MIYDMRKDMSAFLYAKKYFSAYFNRKGQCRFNTVRYDLMNRVKKMIHATQSEIAPYTGTGVTAALLDTGIVMHPDIRKQVLSFQDFVAKRPDPYDDSGHGTHVAGCLCGNGYCSNGFYSGVASGCRIVACKVLDDKGEGSVEQMVEAIRYVLFTRKQFQTRILNISVGIGKIEEKKAQDELICWLEEAWEAGLLVVVAAGNKGPGPNTISPLGMSTHVISVGCHDGKNYPDKKNSCENYSGRGPFGNRLKKPDIVAPGTEIISCNAAFKGNRKGSITNAYQAKSGTSMAVPLISAAAALLWQKYPEMSNRLIRDRILFTAQDLGEDWGKQGWGMLHIANALKE